MIRSSTTAIKEPWEELDKDSKTRKKPEVVVTSGQMDFKLEVGRSWVKSLLHSAIFSHRLMSCCAFWDTGRNVLFSNLMPLIGQFPYSSPSVFNYYLPGFKPSDFPEGTVGPEFEIFTPPMAISFMNGMTSLIERGLGPSHCGGGFGFEAPQNCSNGELHLGELECVQPTIDQMDLLLTGADQLLALKRIV